MTTEDLRQLLPSFAEGITLQEKNNILAFNIPLNSWQEVAKTLRHDSRLQFDMLLDHAAIDWPNENSLELVYQLYSTTLNHEISIYVKLPRENAFAPSLYQIWPIAEWQEREVFDLFGVRYSGHPDLRRLFLEDEWVGHPLLKDFKDDFTLERPW